MKKNNSWSLDSNKSKLFFLLRELKTLINKSCIWTAALPVSIWLGGGFYSGVTPEQLDQSNPTYASHWRSGADRQTAAAPPTAPTGAHHATCCRGSWTAQTKVIPPRLVHMFTLLYLMHSHDGQDTSANRESWDVRSLPLKPCGVKKKSANCEAADGQDEWKAISTNQHFSLCCVQSCQVNREGTVECVSKSRINVIIWPIKLWNEVLHKLFRLS